MITPKTKTAQVQLSQNKPGIDLEMFFIPKWSIKVKNIREVGHTQLIKRVSCSRGVYVPNPKFQILNPKSLVAGPEPQIPNLSSHIPNHEKFG